MVRSFPTRIANSLMGVVLLIPCLLVYLACATPFPLDSLEEGMTTEAVREKFGAPEDVQTAPEGVEPFWTYVDEEKIWFPTILLSSVFLPHCVFLSVFLSLPIEGEIFCNVIEKKPVILHFEGHSVIVGFDQPAVGDGDAVGVARQIGKDLVGSAEWFFGVDHPFGG